MGVRTADKVFGGGRRLTLYQRRAGGTAKKNAAGGRGWGGAVGGVFVGAVVGMLVL